MQKEFFIKVGNDNGNSEHDIIIEGNLIRQPNVYAKIRKIPMLDELKEEAIIEKIEENLIVSIVSPSAETGNYMIGECALKSGEKVRSIEVGVDNNKVDNNIVMVNTLSQIAGYACKKYFEEAKTFDELKENSLKVNVDMATALPISQYNTKSANEFSERFMKGVHNVIVYIGAYQVRVEISFNFVKTIPEGVTAAWALKHANDEIFKEYNSKPNVKQINASDFKKSKILHVAIGEGTTELPVTTGIEFDPNFINGINNGIGHAIDKSLGEFKRNLGLTNYSRQKFSEVLKDQSHKYHVIAEDIVEGYIEDESEEILHATKNEIQRANNEVDFICVYGGGSIPMRKNLEKLLQTYADRAMINLLYIPEKEAVTLEAKGLYEFATSKVFSLLSKSNK
ncbi:MAG: ParM/StbA family protein [Terrisporobacter othiniensis]|uniref:ParM/StbA family protein n=1 Tax=Terrisporobacter othiniensis TaxID=1577792 RepID=UPI002A76042F|nr:ParM/StbA family protein [Terrisporobacter othiniensis]MDY3372121.1 ParM/StbA family protein [Terrisporobacter othiniensis]